MLRAIAILTLLIGSAAAQPAQPKKKPEDEALRRAKEVEQRLTRLALEAEAAARLDRMRSELARVEAELARTRGELTQAVAIEEQRRIRYAQERFGSHESSRGRVYVKNGPPSKIDASPEGQKEIWRYEDGREYEFTGPSYDLFRFRFDGKDFIRK